MLYQIVWILCAIKEGLYFGCSSGTLKLITVLKKEKKLSFQRGSENYTLEVRNTKINFQNKCYLHYDYIPGGENGQVREGHGKE